MHISAQLIDSFSMMYGSWSCAKELLLISLEAHDKAQSSKIFSKFLCKNFSELFFGPSCWNCIFQLPRLRASLRQTARASASKKSSHIFGVPKPGCWDGLFAGIIESHNFCLMSHPGEIAYSNLANRELSNDVSVFVVRQKSCTSHHFTPFANWSMTKCCFHHFRGL